MSPSFGVVIATVGAFPRVTETEALPVPKAFVQETAIVLAPSCSATELTVVLAVFAPPTAQVVPPGIDAAPLTVKLTLVDAEAMLAAAGEVIATTGGSPRLTDTATVLVPYWLVHATVIVFAPSCSGTGLTVALKVPAPPTVHVVPLGIDATPATVKLTFVETAAVFDDGDGAAIATAGGSPRLTVTPALPLPKMSVQLTVTALAPIVSATLLLEALAEVFPLTLQVVPFGIVADPFTVKATLVDVLCVLAPSDGVLIATTGGVPR